MGDLSVNVSVQVGAGPVITSPNTTTFTVGTPGSFTVTTTGSPTPTLSMSGTLPNGVTFSPSTDVLGGTPTVGTGGVYAITFTASNGNPPDATQNFTLRVEGSSQPALSKEYVYLGGRLLAIEAAGAPHGKRSRSESPQIRTASFSEEHETVKLILVGLNFIPRSQIVLNGAAVTTVFVDSTRLKASVLSRTLPADGTMTIQVINPPDQGGVSNALTLSGRTP